MRTKRVSGAEPKVLVVEDEPLIRFALADDLADAGFRVLEAANADEAIVILGLHDDIRLLVTDIDMPGTMDGLRLSAMVRDRWPPVRIIVTSGKRIPPGTALPAGSRFVPKPYTTSGVLDAVRTVLA
jgi:two-component system, response regulator PdtaR